MSIDDWLKTTIPGIVILGAVGSILAAAILWLLGRYLPAFAKAAFHQALRRVVSHFVLPSVKHAVRLHFLDTKNKVESFQTLQLMKFGLSLFVSLCALVVFVAVLPAAPDPVLRIAVVVPLVVFFLGIWIALRTLAIIVVPLYFDLEAEILKVKAARLAEIGVARES